MHVFSHLSQSPFVKKKRKKREPDSLVYFLEICHIIIFETLTILTNQTIFLIPS